MEATESKRKYMCNCKRDTREFKVKKIIEYYFDKDKDKIDVTDKNFASAIKLEKMIKLYNEDTDLLKKYYNMKRLFRTVDEFSREYKVLEEYTDLDNIQQIYSEFEKITQFLRGIEEGLSSKRKKELLELEKDGCFDDYPYAQYFIQEFINYKNSPYLNDFLAEKCLYERDFNRFVSIIIRLDDDLLDQYLKKESENRLSRQLDVIRKIENLRSGVKTGYTKEGLKFDDVELYRNLPFYDQESARIIIDDFGFKKLPMLDQKLKTVLENLCFEDSNEIIKHVHSRNVFHNNPSLIREEDIMKTNFLVNKQELTDNGKKIIIDYMKAQKIPFVQGAFTAVKNKYMNEGLITGPAKELKK